jgi:hypothetical protein
MMSPKEILLVALTGLMMAGCSTSAPTTTSPQATSETPSAEARSYSVQQYGYRMPRYGSRRNRCSSYCRSASYGYYAYRQCMRRCQTGAYWF